ncbi:hypothetical protein [Hwangdonia seohaensis]|uniref:Uncharacterized protein n=1 Tax=Hwangdonia seohaensis TaxID=1240727 RepID=A0ABW3RFD3_9FLAO|nr:hypothetical protein [Hwangdonia seohaensis]
MKSSYSHIFLFWTLPSISMVEAYKKKCKLLNNAMYSMKSIEITTFQNKILKLKEIGIESGRFYGFESIKGGIKKISLNINDIKNIILL